MQSANLLTALEAELAEQVEESRRPPFETVEAIGNYVDVSEPKPSDSSALRMCVGRITDQAKLVRLELVDGTEAEHVDKIMEALDKLDSQRRSKFVFSLTAWKPKYRSIYDNPMYFQTGGVYVFPKVHALRRYFNLLQGSMQLNTATPPQRVIPASGQDRDDVGDGDTVPTEPGNRSENGIPGEEDTVLKMTSAPSTSSRRGVLRCRAGESGTEFNTEVLSTERSCTEMNPSPLKRSRATASRASAK
ncbi:hypothetical protein DVH05_003022 [Phytophthora capsici]|nr:hypothetical protein DVH05_003022 [Phytophthora capsici]